MTAAPTERSSPQLPEYSGSQFRLDNPPECDMIMKGGVTSGIVYPYAILEIATKYRLRSLGGTSAGAIAAAFAAAAEFGRSNGRPEAFLLLKKYSDALPGQLVSLFQPSPSLAPVTDLAKKALTGGIRPMIGSAARHAVAMGAGGALLLGAPSFFLQSSAYATTLAALLGFLVGFAIGAYRWARGIVRPIAAAVRRLPAEDFGFCTGKTQPRNDGPALTDWIHRALQDIAFGDPDHPKPLTFGDLQGPDPERPLVDLRVVTTNLSMRRPHALPRLGMQAGFMPEEWERLFPKPVMTYLRQGGSAAWRRFKGARRFPSEQALPVVVAVRMSLSFPLLFTAVPLRIRDTELSSIVKKLGGDPYTPIRKVYFSDGGISSNFPIHLFDSHLPSRPTFAFSLEELVDVSWKPDRVPERVALPNTAAEGMGVQINPIFEVPDFAWSILNSAKDWQDQLLSELTGQRERVARIFLKDKEGGLNISMSPETSQQLMYWGYQAGNKFISSEFSFDEHRWRRLLVFYKNIQQSLAEVDRVWLGGFGDWYRSYSPDAKSYKALSQAARRRMAEDLERLLAARSDISELEEKLPGKSGKLKIAPIY